MEDHLIFFTNGIPPNFSNKMEDDTNFLQNGRHWGLGGPIILFTILLIGLKLACLPNVSFQGCQDEELLVLGSTILRGWAGVR
jgi:hypothetical protein